MPDIDRALVLLSLDGMSYREISAITGLAEGNVGVALMRARKRLTNQLKGVANELE
jgi:RNA polymerase sigma-70 factor (ECF subfamily)